MCFHGASSINMCTQLKKSLYFEFAVKLVKVKLKLTIRHEEKRSLLHNTLFSLLCSVLKKQFAKLIPERSILYPVSRGLFDLPRSVGKTDLDLCSQGIHSSGLCYKIQTIQGKICNSPLHFGLHVVCHQENIFLFAT